MLDEEAKRQKVTIELDEQEGRKMSKSTAQQPAAHKAHSLARSES